MKSLDNRFKFFLLILVADMAFGILGFKYFEGLSLVEAFYFTVVTITTVGYGDIAPITDMGRAIAGVLIITGVAAFTGVVATFTESLVIGKEEEFRREKLSIVLSVFYSEFGNELIVFLIQCDRNANTLRPILAANDTWRAKDLSAARTRLERHEYDMDVSKIDLAALLQYIEERTETLLRMLENPNLHKDSSLTDLLRAILHFKEELRYRGDFTSLPASDLKHLSGDATRVFRMLSLQWLEYLGYIRENYPYLYSLALRVNPFKEDRAAIVQE